VWRVSPTEYWYPMLPLDHFVERADVTSFDQLAFYWNVGWDGLRSILSSLGIARLFQLSRGNEGDQCDMDVAFLELPVVGSSEMYWTSKSGDWLVYLSHEQTVTVAGECLLHAIQEVWPDWQNGLSHEQTGKWPDQLGERLNF
ncbi:MAG TPA: hypothetical protein VF221_12180, partial [Chloroflexota bacterium]